MLLAFRQTPTVDIFSALRTSQRRPLSPTKHTTRYQTHERPLPSHDWSGCLRQQRGNASLDSHARPLLSTSWITKLPSCLRSFSPIKPFIRRLSASEPI